MERTAAIADLAECLASHIEAAQSEDGLEDEDINLAIRWVMIERGIQDDG
ncbi:MAG: hypothetical protein DDT32_02278 [Syntrophomonadaceae bacterium]|nr:hypothetical protein [Bacillota bacterium]